MQTLSNTRLYGVTLMPITGSTGGTPSPPDLGSNAIPAASQVDAIAIPCHTQTIKCIQLVHCRFGLRKT